MSDELTRERAFALSEALDVAGISHTVGLSVIENLAPPKTYRVSVFMRELTSEKLRELEEIVEPFGMGVHFGIAQSRELDLWPLDRLRRKALGA